MAELEQSKASRHQPVSTSATQEINIQDEEIDDWVEVEVDLHDVIVPEIETDNKVELADNVFIELRYPRYVDMMRLDEDDELNTNIEMIAMCIDKVYEGEEVMEMSSFSKGIQSIKNIFSSKSAETTSIMNRLKDPIVLKMIK